MEADILESKKDLYLVHAEVWRPIFCKSKEDLYLVPNVWRPICLIKGLVLMVVFCSVHRHNCLFHYHGCSACHQNSSATPYLFRSYPVDVSGFLLFPFVHIPIFGGLSGSEDRGGGDNSIQFINIGRVGDKSFKE